jgi:hypothetical protein
MQLRWTLGSTPCFAKEEQMRRSIVRNLTVTAVATMSIALGAVMFRKPDSTDQKGAPKRIAIDLANPEAIGEYIDEWIPAHSGAEPERIGTIEGEPVSVAVKNHDLTCSFESALITVKIDPSRGGRLVSLYFSTVPMRLEQSVSLAETLLTMVGGRRAKLRDWTAGAIAWTKNPNDWPEDKLTPPDAWFADSGDANGRWYDLQVRRSYSDTEPWRVTLDVGPSE